MAFCAWDYRSHHPNLVLLEFSVVDGPKVSFSGKLRITVKMVPNWVWWRKWQKIWLFLAYMKSNIYWLFCADGEELGWPSADLDSKEGPGSLSLHVPLVCESVSRSVMSGSLQPCGLLPARLLCPWNSQTRILEWVAISSSRGSSQPRAWPSGWLYPL